MLEDKKFVVFKHKHKEEYGQWMCWEKASGVNWVWVISKLPLMKYDCCYEGITAFRLSLEVGPQSLFGQEKSLEIGKDYILEGFLDEN